MSGLTTVAASCLEGCQALKSDELAQLNAHAAADWYGEAKKLERENATLRARVAELNGLVRDVEAERAAAEQQAIEILKRLTDTEELLKHFEVE